MEYNLKQYAHIGDAVWELFVREQVIKVAQNQKTMHKMTTDKVRAEFQAETLEKLGEFLTEDEQDIARRGRNLSLTINKRNNPAIHRQATAFEVLTGYWYLNDKQRLNEILDIIKEKSLWR